MAIKNGMRSLWKTFLLLTVVLTGTASAQVTFSDVTEEWGVRFQHNSGAFGKKYLPETMGAGVIVLDYNGDGNLDLYFPNGTDWPEQNREASRPALFRNDGGGSFSDVTREAGLSEPFYGVGGTAADYDNDGDVDLFVTSLHGDRLFTNQGDGTFLDTTRDSGIDNPHYGTSAAFLDYDRDGLLDLFVANYVEWSIEEDIFCTLDGENKAYCTPESYQGVSPLLFQNRGNGKFQNVTREAGILDDGNKGLGVLVFDYNNDHWPDIMLANDTQPNRLWENQQDGTFLEMGVLAGIAFSEDGVARGAMGIDAADYDHTGYFSVVIGNFSNEMISLYHNEQTGFFIDDSPTSAVGPASLLTLAFGTFFFDYDLDGYQDIFAANGHVEDEINAVQKRVTHAQPPHLFKNLKGRGFEEVTAAVGDELARPRVARGAAYADLDNDGDLDLILTSVDGPAQLFRNDGGNRNHWLSVTLSDPEGNRDAIGAVARLRAGGLEQTHMVKTGGSYCSQSQLRLTFGLGPSDDVEALQIKWADGEISTYTELPANRHFQIERGKAPRPR